MSRIDDIRHLLERHNRHLQKLQEQKASLGLLTPPHILTQIEDVEVEIEHLQTELQTIEDINIREPQASLSELTTDIILNSRVQVFLQGDFSSLSDDRRTAAIVALAALLEIPPQAIKVYRVAEGSIIFDLGIPSDTIPRLRLLLKANDAQLRLLGIEKIILEMGSGEIEEWVFKEGKFDISTAKFDQGSVIYRIIRMITTLLNKLKVKDSSGPVKIKQQAGDNATQIGNVSAGRDVIVAGHDIHMSADERRARAERKTDEGRQKVQEWGERISESGWDEQAWHLLGFALQFTHEAVEIYPNYQRAWTLMADIYHRIGKEELAKKCLKKSYSLASPGPNFPGRFYKQVEQNIKSGYPFNSAGGLKRPSLPSWFEAKYQRYWEL